MVNFTRKGFEASFETGEVKLGHILVADDDNVAVSSDGAKGFTCPINQIRSYDKRDR